MQKNDALCSQAGHWKMKGCLSHAGTLRSTSHRSFMGQAPRFSQPFPSVSQAMHEIGALCLQIRPERRWRAARAAPTISCVRWPSLLADSWTCSPTLPPVSRALVAAWGAACFSSSFPGRAFRSPRIAQQERPVPGLSQCSPLADSKLWLWNRLTG